MKSLALSLCLLLLPLAASAESKSAEELLRQYDAIMGPASFEGVMVMTAHREDGSTRTYRMKVMKSGADRFRAWFQEPAASRGQEILRVGDNSWVYMPNLKRALRIANRDSFQGGDFNNADVLRTNYTRDYDAKLVSEDAQAYQLELHAKTDEAAYDRINLWLSKAEGIPLKGEYYTVSGKLLRTAEFMEVRDFGGLRRPSRVLMRNMIVTQRFSELTFDRFDVRESLPSGRFVLDDLGR
ncbi:outer membrane lipoprotein-sorting protein [Pyxidicoccus parkwayensis]|uniref:Outer membrane lipoprotein-sorting protein n=1 Tax=Pyxidicoccus parkwayensis TaxID=2813578 RepID=A0ABX7NU64_9BACT|nr:outer membrane lipoprotein-sorting protein [Pyxidicoccus parkwaysis]QSQ21966.1 outer membrane lipoprotein-sorting protein [Pyxidicoccus parkwaysis]